MIQKNLIKNSISAYFTAVEIHNKPQIAYRYETVVLLIINSWELILKAYTKKYTKHSIFDREGHTISLDKALAYVTDDINSVKNNSFTAIKENIIKIEEYRNNIIHFYCDELEPYIFMLVARSALNYVEFVKKYFSKDIMAEDGLFIIPLGFKLPFKPEDFLSKKVAKYSASIEAQKFIDDIVHVTKRLGEEGIEDSIVLGFDIRFENIKKAKNKEILAAITTEDVADVKFSKIQKVRFDENAEQAVNVNDEEFRLKWKYSHADLVAMCKNDIKNFNQGKMFNDAKRSLENNKKYVFVRKLDNKSAKSASKKFYTDEAFLKIKAYYELHAK